MTRLVVAVDGVVLLPLMFFGGVWLWRRQALGYVLAVGVLSAYYAPVWAQLPVTTAAFEQRVFLPMWR